MSNDIRGKRDAFRKADDSKDNKNIHLKGCPITICPQIHEL
tara:strand:- start:1023 stop:1145 length:123 start_codon:yes stop_codon:yes gene_type:complete